MSDDNANIEANQDAVVNRASVVQRFAAAMQAHAQDLSLLAYLRDCASRRLTFEEFRLALQMPLTELLRAVVGGALAKLPPTLATPRVHEAVQAAIGRVQLSSDGLLARLFAFFDRDGDGFVEQGEVVEAVRVLSEGDVSGLFRVLDADGDDRVSRDDALRLMNDALTLVRDMVNSLVDIAFDAVHASGVLRRALTMAFAFLDVDGDEQVSADDLQAFVRGMAPGGDVGIVNQLPIPPPLRLFADMTRARRDDFLALLRDSADGTVSEGTIAGVITEWASTVAVSNEQLDAGVRAFLARGMPVDQQAIVVAADFYAKLFREWVPRIFHAAFPLLDRSGTGAVSIEDFDSLTAFTAIVDAENRFDAITDTVVKFFDRDRDGKVSIDEAEFTVKTLLDVVRESLHMVVDIGKHMATDIVFDKLADKAIAHLDADADGSVSRSDLGTALEGLGVFAIIKSQLHVLLPPQQ